jgi:hypothetical protein
VDELLGDVASAARVAEHGDGGLGESLLGGCADGEELAVFALIIVGGRFALRVPPAQGDPGGNDSCDPGVVRGGLDDDAGDGGVGDDEESVGSVGTASAKEL